MVLIWPVERAAKEGVVCYLDTELNGEVVRMYEKRGYVMVDRLDIDLQACGIHGGTCMHIAMIKESKASVEKNKVEEGEVR